MFKKIFIFFILALLTRIAGAQTPEQQPGFQGETELGNTVTSGNTSTNNLAARTENKYLLGQDLWSLNGRYLRDTDHNIETALFWSASLRYDRVLSERINVYIGYKVEADPYSGFVQRDSVDLGGKSYFVKKDNFYWFGEAGLRYSRTHLAPDSEPHETNFDNFLRLYMEMQLNINPNSYTKIWVEYLPNLTRNRAYLANAEASISAVLTELLSLKISYLVKNQNEPPPQYEKTDAIFLTTLVAKY